MPNNYPLISAATMVTLATLILSLLTAYGVNITVEQREIWLQIIALAAPWAVVWWGHRTTTPLIRPTTESGLPLTGPNDELTDAQAKAQGKDGL